MKDNLGDRIKSQYENRTRYFLPRRTYTIIRLDQRAGRSYTKELEKPFDARYSSCIDYAANNLMKEAQGARFGYCQSDEISILLTDFDSINTQAWFDGNIQKICSVSSSIVTAGFNYAAFRFGLNIFANFDCRVYSIPDRVEVMNNFIWRNKDCIRNSISMAAQSKFSHKELQFKSLEDQKEMLINNNFDWDNIFEDYKFGRFITKETTSSAWDFAKDQNRLLDFIPNYT